MLDREDKVTQENCKATNECSLKSAPEIHKNIVVDILVEVDEKISKIEKLKIELQKNNSLSYFWNFLEKCLKSIQEFEEILDFIKICRKDTPIDELPLPLCEIMTVLENVEKEIELLEKANEALLFEIQVKNLFYIKISENQDDFKSQFISKLKELEFWGKRQTANRSLLLPIENAKLDSFNYGIKLTYQLISRNIKENFYYRNIDLDVKWENWVTEKELEKLNLHHDCKSENSEIFCIWNSSSVYKMDLKSMKITKILPHSKGVKHSALIYYKDYVYIFSANSSSYYLEKYDLKCDKKSIMPTPPVNALSNYSCTIYQDSILFCAKECRALYKFDPLIEDYSEIPLAKMDKLSSKMLFTGNMKAYIADSKIGIFESGENNEYVWNKIGEYNRSSFTDKYLIYLSSLECDSVQIYRFSLLKKEIHQIVLDYFRSFDRLEYPICILSE
ncbi:unnamed protein product [Blepharisma stoltei]|uniref:Uncharacterized protein n=1 Tax=Blepharisma stoltei TaxID=1481888 RepID=A0AAU9IRG7_9CILI|nr:unnamed protein product [Blepharisma stoltei]